MSPGSLLRVVIDTNVVFEGLTKQGGAAGFVVDAWLDGLIQVYVSNALAYEYKDVLSRKLSVTRWEQIKPVLGTLLARSEFTTIYYSWRPTSPDQGDDLVIDCAMNANAMITTSNLRDFTSARESLGLSIMTPVELITLLAMQAG
jgi:putative PIN family toxin of toxin-antitoxin system